MRRHWKWSNYSFLSDRLTLSRGHLLEGKEKGQRWKSFLVCIFEFSIIWSNCQCQKFSVKCFYHKKTGTWNILSSNDHSIRNYTESTSLCFIKSRVIFLQFSGDLVQNTSHLLTCIAASYFLLSMWTYYPQLISVPHSRYRHCYPMIINAYKLSVFSMTAWRRSQAAWSDELKWPSSSATILARTPDHQTLSKTLSPKGSLF